jgi:hypothetical protein
MKFIKRFMQGRKFMKLFVRVELDDQWWCGVDVGVL